MDRVRRTLQSLLVARRETARLENRFFKQLGRLAAIMPNGAKAAPAAPSRRPVRRMLKCSRCSRRFAMPLHLGRHVSATHKRGRKNAA